eukprot:TRINITY_DN26745_c0_g1_i2.p1 TRINITY_DN26745_c0_g1~~TRINITY_DN26745_c0_g1_i2.p1  ORF type:complete len:301 (+),score=63.88 TRINITY_DN26745_c0_g1_i2:410-1312(+)
MGLAPASAPGSLLHSLKDAHALSKNVMGIYLSEDTHRTGSLSLGGIERQHIVPGAPLHWHKATNPSEWSLKLKDILVDGKPSHICDDRPGGYCPAVIDSGSSLITGPRGEVEKVLTHVRPDVMCSGLKNMPRLTLQLEDQDGKDVSYDLEPKEYTLQTTEEVAGSAAPDNQWNGFSVLSREAQVPKLQDRCDSGLGVMDVPGRKWVLGDTFLRRYYSIYDFDTDRVGLVRSLHVGEDMPAAANAAPGGDDALSVAAKTASAPGPLCSLLAPMLWRASSCQLTDAKARQRRRERSALSDFL